MASSSSSLTPHDESLSEERVALKLLDERGLRQRFMNEFKRVQSLSHPVFIKAYELGYDAKLEQLYSVLEWADGFPLAPRQLEERSEFISLASSLLKGMDHLHRHGFAHGDIAPHNLLRTPKGKTALKVLDLGAGGRIGSGAGHTSGVLSYTAPERLEGKALSVQSDLWSIGCVLFGLIHGCHPFPEYPRQNRLDRGPERSRLDT